MLNRHGYCCRWPIMLVAFVLLTAAAVAAPPASYAPLPDAVTSFGAVSDHNWLYVFGGHKGERHDYSAEKISGAFYRLSLTNGTQWERLPDSQPAQGVPLVAHGGQVFRIGGMAARNAAGARQDLCSTAIVQCFHPQNRSWQDRIPMPAPRSSHDAVVIGDQLYVAGGWQLEGGTNKPVWPDYALTLDLAHPGEGWKRFPQPFQRRALALAASGTRVFCIGGMNSDNQPTLAVDVYDTATGQWSPGPDLPPGKHKGFGCSAIAQAGGIYASAFQGDLVRLSTDGRTWEVVGKLQHPRMAHRLVPVGSKELVALGGEDGESKRPDLELLSPAPAERASTSPSATLGFESRPRNAR